MFVHQLYQNRKDELRILHLHPKGSLITIRESEIVTRPKN